MTGKLEAGRTLTGGEPPGLRPHPTATSSAVKSRSRPADRASMNGQLRLNVILPIVLLAALAAAAGLFMLSRGPSTPTETAVQPLPRPTHVPQPAAKTAPKAARPVAAKPRPAVKPARPKVKLNKGLP